MNSDKVDECLYKLEGKIDTLTEKFEEMNVTLARQNVTLDDHIRRTELLEEAIGPLQAQHHQLMGALKLLGVIAAIAGILEAIARILK